MGWKECEKRHIRKVKVDEEKIKSLLKVCSVRLKFLEKQDVDRETASIISEGYYEIIKELLTALLLKKGLKSDNHECLVSFFKENFPDREYETHMIYELKNIRNRIAYDGLFVEKVYLEKNKVEFKHIIEFLLKQIKEE